MLRINKPRKTVLKIDICFDQLICETDMGFKYYLFHKIFHIVSSANQVFSSTLYKYVNAKACVD